MLADPVTGLWSGVSVLVNTAAGHTAEILTAGPVESADWAASAPAAELIVGKSYFLQADGRIDLVPPDDGAIIRVGRAVTNHILLVTFDLKIR